MGLIKILLKAILIPIVILIVIIVGIIVLIRMRREKRKEERQMENQSFQPPPIAQWTYPSYPQKPEPVVYPAATPGHVEHGIAHVH
jgi:flagellar biosynthesis/type III secretory pathway M-ring protein FliF/YscJ